MSKDLSKEYKEAVMNDLPDLWGRIEAAVDAKEAEEKNKAANTNNTVTPTVQKVENNTESKSAQVLKAVPNDQVNTANSVSSSASTKKKKKFPVWIFAAIPSAAILLIAVVPLLFFGGLAGTKSANTAMSDAAPAAANNSYEAAADAYYMDAASEPEVDEEVAFEEEAASESSESAKNYKNENAGIDNNTSFFAKESDDRNLTDFSQLTQGDYAEVAPGIISGDTTEFIRSETETVIVIVHLIYTDDGEYVAYSTVEQVIGDERICSENFNGFEKGDTFDAYIDSDTEFEEGSKYKVTIHFASDDRRKFRMEKTE